MNYVDVFKKSPSSLAPASLIHRRINSVHHSSGDIGGSPSLPYSGYWDSIDLKAVRSVVVWRKPASALTRFEASANRIWVYTGLRYSSFVCFIVISAGLSYINVHRNTPTVHGLACEVYIAYLVRSAGGSAAQLGMTDRRHQTVPAEP